MNILLYIILSYLIMITPTMNVGGLAGFIIWFISPISLPIRLGSYLT